MDLASYREKQEWTLAALAEKLGIAGANPARAAQRIETGEHQADADLIVAIERLTEGLVTGADMIATRLAYLEDNGKRRNFEPADAAE